jgi:signal transduction histidine kinase/CheY-like chemotaxis protein
MIRSGEPDRWRVPLLWIGAAVLVAASITLAVRQESLHRREVVQLAKAQTDVLAGSVSAALAFEDAAAMRQYLTALMRNPQVAAAGVYGPNGAPEALLASPQALPPPSALHASAAGWKQGRVQIARAVIEQGQPLGYVYLQTVPDNLAEFVARHIGLLILTLLALLLLSLTTGSALRLANANDRLGEEMQARAAAEEALRQSQKLEALGQLTGGIAHDFNNLLQAIHGAFELILSRASDERTVRRWASNGLEAADRGASLTRQLLAFSRQQKLETKPVAVKGVLDRMADLMARALGPKVELVFDLDEGPGVVMSDSTQLELAVMNLAVNARDAMPNGGRVTIRTRELDVKDDAVLTPGRYLELQVIDTGEGMSPQVMRRAFDPFFTTKAVGKGTGLGLAQVYGLARQAGGDARISSTQSEGTTVTLLLRKATSQPPAAEMVQRGPGAEAPQAGTVLLVDDDPAVRDVVRGGLELRGFKVLDVASGEDALAAARGEQPQAAVIDYAMPGMDGAQTAEELRRMIPELPIILASGHADTAAVERALGGSATVLRKPFDMQALSDELTRMLSMGA